MIYDWIQRLAGSRRGLKILARELSRLPSNGKILDVGGGTGAVRHLFGEGWDYVCLEPDSEKLRVFRRKHPGTRAWKASADRIPCEKARFDLCLLIAVAHHLDENQFHKALAEIQRVLKPLGKLLLLDPLWIPTNFPGRVLWWMDRGAYPRTAKDLNRILGHHFLIESTRHHRIHHDYWLVWAAQKIVPSSREAQVLQTA